MADRFPLILNTSANQIQEIASGDTLDLSGNNIKGVGIITATNISGNIIAGAGTSNIVAGIVTAVTFKGDGDFVELDVDGHTNLDNVSIAGVSTHSEGIHIPINKRLDFGGTAGSGALNIRHYNGHSHIENNTGHFFITQGTGAASHPLIIHGGTELQLKHYYSNGGALFALKSVRGAQTEIYYQGAKKIETSSTGITVTGSVVATGADINGDLDVDGHTNLDNVSVAGVSTFGGTLNGMSADFAGQIQVGTNNSKFGNNYLRFENAGIGYFDHNGTGQNINFRVSNSSSLDTTPLVVKAAGIDVTGNITATGNVSVGGVLTYEDVTNVDSVGIITARDDIKIITDNKKLQIGAGQDLKLYHDGNHSYISNNGGAGNLTLYGNGTNSIVLQPVPGENGIVANSNGSVELFYNNTKVLETKGYGLDITGGFIQTGSSIVNDNGQFKLGTGGDYKLYHDGSSSFMDNVTGDLYMRNSSGQILIRANTDCYISNYAANEHRAAFKNNGAVELYYDGSKKFETVSDGAHMTRELRVVGTAVNDFESGRVRLTEDGSGMLGGYVHYDGASNILKIGTHPQSDSTVSNDVDAIEMNRTSGSNNVELNYNGTKKFETTSSGATVTGALTAGTLIATNSVTSNNNIHLNSDSGKLSIGTGSDLQLYHSGSHSYIQDNGTGALYIGSNGGGVFIRGQHGEESIIANSNGSVELYYDASKKLETSTSGVTVTGNVTASSYGSLGNYSGSFGRIRVGADVYGNTIKTQGDNNLNITVPHSVYFNTDANSNGSDAGTARLRIYSGGIVPTSDKAVDLGSTSIAWRNVYTDNIVTTTALSNRNVIHNGTMFVAQRGTSQSGVNSSGYAKAADRWKLEANGSNVGTYTVSRSTDNPGEFGYSYKLQCTTAHSSLANNEMYEFVQYIEGRNVLRFNKGNSTAKPFALSFSVKTNKTGTYAVLLLDHQHSRMCCANYTVSNTGWNRYEIVFPADTTGEWTYSTNYRLSVKFCLLTGGLFQGGTLQTTWGAATNSNSRVGHNVNLADTVGNTFYITGVQLEAASACTPYEHRDYTEVVRDCQRYLYTTPILGAGVWNSAQSFFTACHVPVPMRVHPTVSTNSGNFSNINIEHTDTYGVNSFTNPSVGHGNPNSTAAQSYSGYSSFIIGLGVSYSIDETGRGGLVVCDAASDYFILDAQL